MVAFHEASMAGDSIEGFGGNVGDEGGGQGAPPDPAFTVDPDAPRAGERATFDASETTAAGEILAYTWAFGDGGTGAGVEPTHVFESAGEYAVELSVVDGDGQTGATTLDVTVESGSTDTATATRSRTDHGTDTATAGDASSNAASQSPSPVRSSTPANGGGSDADGTPASGEGASTDGTAVSGSGVSTDGTAVSGESGPGFGVPGTLAGVGALACALRRRLGDDERRE
jgi:PGF-CTERM protein